MIARVHINKKKQLTNLLFNLNIKYFNFHKCSNHMSNVLKVRFLIVLVCRCCNKSTRLLNMQHEYKILLQNYLQLMTFLYLNINISYIIQMHIGRITAYAVNWQAINDLSLSQSFYALSFRLHHNTIDFFPVQFIY